MDCINIKGGIIIGVSSGVRLVDCYGEDGSQTWPWEVGNGMT